MEAELLDWELVHGSDTEPTDSIALEKESWSSSVIDDEHLQVADGGEPIEDGSNSCSDSGGKQFVSRDSGIVYGEEEIGSDSEAVTESGGGAVAVGCGDESKSRESVWWKMPFVLVNYSAFRIRPVWSLSMAAALVGFLLLGRRLHNIKNKPQRIHLKVDIDYTKGSQVMSQAARLNQAFTEVRRVPVIRPALPAPGAWPVLSLR